MAEPREPSPVKSESPQGAAEAEARADSGTRPVETQVAAAAVVLISAIFIWWAWKQGAYFDTVFYPGAAILFLLLAMLILRAPLRARLRGPAWIALAAMTALAMWTLLSFAWTDFHVAAVQNFERVLLYATAFGLGLWVCNMAGRQMMIPLAGVAAAGAVIGVVTIITLATGTDVNSYVHSDATLRYPIGYRNAEACFMLICLWPTIVLAAEGDLPWQLRALAIGAATMLLELVVLAESRGSLPAAVIALVAFLVLSPRRLRAATYLALATLPVLPALPTLLDVFQHGHGGPGLVPFLRDASRAITFTTIASVALAGVCIRGIEFRLNLGRERIQLISRVAAVAAIAVAVVGGSAFLIMKGGPVKFLDQRVTEFGQGTPDLRSQGARFGVNVGTNRGDFWRVALDEGSDHPLKGGGAGSFATVYLQERESDDSPRDPHSVELLMFSELGIVGLLLFGTFAVSSTVSAVRSRRLGPSAAALVAGSLASGAYWLMHSSYDWFLFYPGLTAPALFLVGAAAAPGIFDTKPPRSLRWRWPAVAVLVVAAVGAAPLFLSSRYSDDALDEYPADPGAAISDLDRAADLNPWDPAPLLTKGLIELRLGQRSQAVGAFHDALDRQPQNYAGHYFLARALAPTDLGAARAEASEAVRLNPLDPLTRSLNRRLQRVKPS
jgi:O-Antigen ligase